MTRRPTGTIRAGSVALLLIAILWCGACASSEGSQAAPGSTGLGTTAPEGFGAVTVQVTAPDGTVQEWCLWLADTEALRQRGLMGVDDPELGGSAGMVFRFDADTTGGFWMKDTLLPLSIAWYRADGPLVSTADMEPCPADTETCPSYAPTAAYRYAVEVPRGGLPELGMTPGSSIVLGSACEPAGGSA